MSDLLSTSAPISSDLSMIAQFLALGIIILGFAIVKREKFKMHGVLMFLAALLNTASILMVMIPTALTLGDTSIPSFNFLFRAHTGLGLIVEGMAVFIVAEWRFRNPSRTCFQRRKWMLFLTISWLAQIITGMLLYMHMYP